MKAIILAAGLGKRLGLENIPKPMYKINGKPILEYNILLLKNHNIKDICINLHYKGEIIKEYFGDGNKWGVKIEYSPEEKLLGTSGAVKNIEGFFDREPFFVIYGDNYTNIDLTNMLNSHHQMKPTATIAMFDPKKVPNSDIAGGVITMDENNTITSFIEGKESKASRYVNAGVYVLESEVLGMIPKDTYSDFGNDIFPKLLRDKKLMKGYLTNSFVFAIDTKEALERAKKVVNLGENK